MQFPPPRRPMARGGTPPRAAPPPPRPVSAELDPVPFPGGPEAALEFAAFEKGLLERGNGRSSASTRSREPPVARRTPISEPNRHSVGWMLAGAGVAATVALLLLLLSSGLLTGVVTAALRVATRS